MRRLALTASLLALACLTAAPLAHGTSYTVTTTADSDDGACTATLCSLRDAFTYTVGNDVITVPAGRYTLGGALTLFHGLTIRGAGAGQTIIDGNGKGRAIEINNTGALDLSRVTVTGGVANANSPTTPGVGAGIFVTSGDNVPGQLTLRDSVVSANAATTAGGGIAVQGPTTIVNSTISGNSANAPIGAGGASGGGIAVLASTLQVQNTTISANTSNGAGAGVSVAAGAPTTIQSATIAQNTSTGTNLAGGIALGTLAQVTATNTIIAGNTTTNCSFGRSAVLTSGYDLASDASCNLTAAGDQQNANPLLGALADNGGPTPTRLPAAGSPAIDRGPATASGCLATDQRGVTRPQGSACDIGAVEVAVAPPSPPPLPPATTPTPPNTDPPPPDTGTTPTLPPPVVGRSVNLRLSRGTVRFKLPSGRVVLRLALDRQVPVGTLIDATNGRVTLTIADGHGGFSTAVFYGGIFIFTQTAGPKPLATLTLAGAKPTCAAKPRRAQHAAAKKKPKKNVTSRRLWGDGKGNFQTKGQYSSATVRGTKWLVEDTCAGTTSRVARGTVAVRDFVKRKTILLKAPHTYVARPKRK
jgi:CSLREA domain-containing protein